MLDLCMNTNFYLSIQSHPQLSTWRVLKVHKDLFAPSLPWSHTMLGLSMPAIDGCRPFILIPCHLALHVSPQKGMQQLYNSLSHIQMHSTLTRGHGKTIFGDKHQRVQYNTLGVRPNRVGMGVIDFDPWAETIGRNHCHNVMTMVRWAELLFESFSPDEVIKHIKSAKDVVPFTTMHDPPITDLDHDVSTRAIPPAKYFGGVAFGCNVFLRCHTDDDFTLSIAHILLDGRDCYDLDDEIVVYFCYPMLGISVPMRPGDFLLFNAKIPHCILTRRFAEHKIMCISLFLKTLVVGGNNNSIPTTDAQDLLCAKYRDMVGLKQI